MEYTYFVILFKNKLKKRIIKKFVRLDKANHFFSEKKQESRNTIFEKIIQNGRQCEFEIGLVKKGATNFEPTYSTDEFGRNLRVKLIDDDMSLIEVLPFKEEEKIYDLQKKNKITTPELIKKYLIGQSIKMISSLNNKIVIQDEDNISLFSLKNENECKRFLDCLGNYFFRIRKSDCIIVKDVSSAQKKYLMNFLSEKGIDKNVLYRKYTTFPRSK